MLVAVVSATFCVLSRGILNVIDRSIFKKEKNDFFKGVILNAAYPFLISLLVTAFFGEMELMFSYVIKPEIVLSAFGAQVAAYVFTYALSKMSVKAVAFSSKIPDLFIPIFLFFITDKFNIKDYVFSLISVILFLPIFLVILRDNMYFNLTITLIIICSLLFQAGVNSFFSMHLISNTWPKFLVMFSAILFWRLLFLSIPFLIDRFRKNNENLIQRETPYSYIFLRSIIAFASQASFFYSITRGSGNLAWPILNFSPLAACFMAHLFIDESVGKVELSILGAFVFLVFIYLIYTG